MRSYKELYFMQDDSRSSGEIVYRMSVRENGPTRLVIEVENVTPVRVLLMTLFHPGDLQFVYFLERQAPDIWGIYSLSRTREGSNIPERRTRGLLCIPRRRFLPVHRGHSERPEPAGAPQARSAPDT